MNNDLQIRIALEERVDNFNLQLPENEQQVQADPKSQRKPSPSFMYKRLSFYSKQKNQIPSVKQAKLRQKQIKYFHNRTFYKRKNHLQQIFKQNMRLYQQLNKQKSFYEINFKNQKKSHKKSKKSHSVSCSQHRATKYIQMDKASKDENFESNTIKLERRFSFSVGRSCKNQADKHIEDKQSVLFRPQSEFAINIKKRYQKNKTEMLPHKNKLLNIEKSTEFYSFKQGNIENYKTQNIDSLAKHDKNDKIFTSSKNPAYMRMKRRPSSGFRC